MPRTMLTPWGLLALLGTGAPTHAQTQDPSAAPAAAEAPAQPAGLLPIPDYSGDLGERSALLGDLWGARTDLAQSGIQFGIDWTNTLQSVVSGGRDPGAAYGGSLDYNLNLDLMRMGILPGALVTLRAETRYGESVNGQTGAVLPVSTDQYVPLSSSLDEDIPIALTTLKLTQFLSESFALFVGKFDTLTGDLNEFASGRGVTQFQNINFIYNPTPLVTVPYATVGGGLVWKPSPMITLASMLISTTDSSTTSGLGSLDEGWTWASEMSVQYRLGRLPGGFNIGGTYAFDNDFATIGRRFTLQPGEGITPVPTQNDSWSVYISAWQYLFAEEPAAGGDAPLNLENGTPDRKGLGLFARIGFADQDTNPIRIAVSGGVGGRGLLPGRDNDVFGVGVYYNEAQTSRLATLANVEDSTIGVEAFYSIALTPAASLSLDLQVIEPVRNTHDPAVVLGTRLLVRF